MSTPFDGITWKLRDASHNSPHPSPLLDPQTSTDSHSRQQLVYCGSEKVYPTPEYENHSPLRSGTKFIICIDDDESVNITFLDNSPQNTQDIWADAQNVYYDREFHAVRGELMYDTKTGLTCGSFGSHFMIHYCGKMETGGSSRRLSIELYSEGDIAKPTFDLLHTPLAFNGVKYANRGSWKADD